MALTQERTTTFNKELLVELLRTKILDINPERFLDFRSKAEKNPDMCINYNVYHMKREDAIVAGLKAGKAKMEFAKKENLTRSEVRVLYSCFPEITPYIMHYDFFLPSLELQVSPEQRKKYLPLCESMEIVGCYAQTELGHGSNVRGVEIEATYDDLKKEFVINSPTTTATKWWIGGLGLAANHALLIARLIIKGQDYGPHPFLVQIRDMKTHLPLNGVDVGEIGPKMGLVLNDNGYIRFNNYRVPKDAMLNRFAKINDSDEYEVIDPNAIKILYLSLIRARASIVIDAFFYLSQALTIAIRYSLVREQFPDPEDTRREKKILDYQIQKSKLFRALARLYAITFTRPFIKNLYENAENNLKNGDDSGLAYLHCIVSLFKSYVTFNVLESIEESRRSCGGHGFMMLSGIPIIYTGYLPTITYDGDNSILTLQSARYFVSVMKKNLKPHDDISFLWLPSKKLEGDPESSAFHQSCFDLAARNKFLRVFNKKQELISAGAKREVVWSQNIQVEAIEACEAIYYSLVHRFFSRGVEQISDSNIRETVDTLRKIFATYELERYHGELIRGGLSPEILDKFKETQIDSLDKIRPNALGLIEAFEISDVALNSVLGLKDGNVYQEMLRTSKILNPINKDPVFPEITKFLRPKL